MYNTNVKTKKNGEIRMALIWTTFWTSLMLKLFPPTEIEVPVRNNTHEIIEYYETVEYGYYIPTYEI